MTRIGLLSDTHSFFDPKFESLFADCDEIWHAGDIGDLKVLDAMRDLKPTRAVFGNIDDALIRADLKEHLRFECDGVDVWMTHIGGYPGKYAPQVKAEIFKNPPQLFITGHSHILKVIYDDKINCLHMNPGAAGRSGFHAVRTALRFTLDKGEIKNLEVIELDDKRFGGQK
ncbi:metallophosphoesterase family protein [Labilibacter marinus]|uniref:metallophosphoesterase family protein n=1 Tax=Labilibacter marinus TaxID=1477105 RepID=UPI000831C600|nr:metallophosphoesterase family protein [Labilibacter marinus]